MKTLRLCAKCGKDLHDVIVTTGQTFYDKETDKVFCSKECFPRKIRNMPVYRDVHSEIIAKQYLLDLGMQPEKCNKKGYPDFKCINNIWVEVKTQNTGLNVNQIKQFKKLIEKGAEVYLLYISPKRSDFFKLCDSNITL